MLAPATMLLLAAFVLGVYQPACVRDALFAAAATLEPLKIETGAAVARGMGVVP